MPDNWYDDWVYKQVRMPATYDKDEGYFAASDLGWYHFWNDRALWMQIHSLVIQQDIERLFDIAKRGDWLARLKAWMALRDLGHQDNEFKWLLYTWAMAEDWSEVVDVSETIIYEQSQFETLSHVAYYIYEQVLDPNSKAGMKTKLKNTKIPTLTPEVSGYNINQHLSNSDKSVDSTLLIGAENLDIWFPRDYDINAEVAATISLPKKPLMKVSTVNLGSRLPKLNSPSGNKDRDEKARPPQIKMP